MLKLVLKSSCRKIPSYEPATDRWLDHGSKDRDRDRKRLSVNMVASAWFSIRRSLGNTGVSTEGSGSAARALVSGPSSTQRPQWLKLSPENGNIEKSLKFQWNLSKCIHFFVKAPPTGSAVGRVRRGNRKVNLLKHTASHQNRSQVEPRTLEYWKINEISMKFFKIYRIFR